MSQVGSFALLLALGLSSYSFLAGILALFRRDAGSLRLGETARRAGIAAFGAVLLAAVVLVTAAFQDDFSIAYIFHHSNRELPAAYKFAVLWSGQEGSLLFWSLLLGGYGFVLRLRYKTDQRLFAHASLVIAAVQVFFLMILNFSAHPFAIMEGALLPDGNGLNPLIAQDHSSPRRRTHRCRARVATEGSVLAEARILEETQRLQQILSRRIRTAPR